MEFNAGRRGGRNEYGAVTRMDRVVAAGYWAGDEVEDEDEGDEDDGNGEEKEWQGSIGGEVEREIMGLKAKLAREVEDEENREPGGCIGQVADGQRCMGYVLWENRLTCVDTGEELPMAERRKMAASHRRYHEINDISIVASNRHCTSSPSRAITRSLPTNYILHRPHTTFPTTPSIWTTTNTTIKRARTSMWTGASVLARQFN